MYFCSTTQSWGDSGYLEEQVTRLTKGVNTGRHSIVSEEIILKGDAMIHVLRLRVYRWPDNRFDCLLSPIYRLSQLTEYHDGNDMTFFPQDKVAQHHRPSRAQIKLFRRLDMHYHGLSCHFKSLAPP